MKRYAAALALSEFIWVYSFERIYALARGLTVSQMVVLEVVYSALIIVLDVPTGALADRWGRKPLLAAARLFTVCEFLLIGLASDFGWFLAAYLAAALGHVCFSGTGHAFVYDSLQQLGRADQFERIQGRLGILEEGMTGVGGILGSAIAAFDLRLPYLITSGFAAAGLLVTLSLSEPPRGEPNEPEPDNDQDHSGFIEQMREAMRLALSRESLRSILVVGALFGAVFTYADEFNQVYASSIGFPLPLFGFLSAALVAFYAAGGAVAQKLRERFGYLAILAVVLAASAALLGAAGRIQNLAGMGMILIFVGLYNLQQILNYGRLHTQVESRQRATIDSAYSTLENLLGVIVGFAFAAIADHRSIFDGYLFLAALVGLYLVYYLLSGRKRV